MANGEIDLAIGFLPQLEEGFYQQKFFRQHYVVISSKSHPRLDRITYFRRLYARISYRY